MVWGKHVYLHVAIATDGCNVIGRHNLLPQDLEAKIVGMMSVHCHAHRLAPACYLPAADLYSMVHDTAKALFNAIFTVSIGLRGDASDYNEDKRSAVAARMQSKGVVE